MKLAILDKDGTLTTPKSGNTFVQNPTDQILMVGAVEGCQRLIEAGYVLAIASNQGGVAASHKTLDEAISEMRYCLHLLKGFDIEIRMAMFCPDFEGHECYVVSLDEAFELVDDNGEEGEAFEQFVGTFRKPGAGMLKAAAINIDREERWMIGDREEDKLAAQAAGFGFLDADKWRKGASPWII